MKVAQRQLWPTTGVSRMSSKLGYVNYDGGTVNHHFYGHIFLLYIYLNTSLYL